VSVEEGDILGLIGPNGAGKSTFFNCLTGDLPVTSGTVTFNNADVTRLPPEARARLGLARTFQVPLTFESMSVLDNATIGARLGISERTARNHVSAVFSKLGVKTRAKAIVLARDVGFGTRRR